MTKTKTKDARLVVRFAELSKELAVKYPDLRIGQLISNIVGGEGDAFYIEDEELVRRMEYVLAHSIEEFWANF